MKRPSLISVILPVLVCIFICILSFGPVMAQSSSSGRFVSKSAPPKTTPKEVPKEAAASTAPATNAADLNKPPAPQPQPQLKLPPVRITFGAPSNNRNTTRPPTVQISPQDIAKIQKIVEIINGGQKNRR